MSGLHTSTDDTGPSRRRWIGCLPHLTVLAIFAVIATSIAVNYERQQSSLAADPTASGLHPTGTPVAPAAQSPDPDQQATSPIEPSPSPPRSVAGKAPSATTPAQAEPSPTSLAQPGPTTTHEPLAETTETAAPATDEPATPTIPPPTIDRDSAFWNTWARTDKPVADGRSTRDWTWGDERSAFTRDMLEPYAEATPDGMRQVIYFDHGRMEITPQESEPSAPWDVTVGLLVVEMVDGKIQTGDDQFDDAPTPAEIDILSRPDSDLLLGVTYADVNSLALREAPSTTEGNLIIRRLNHNGTISSVSSLADYEITSAIRVQAPGIDHSVAAPFWEYMNQVDEIYLADDQGGTERIVQDRLFVSPYYATGFPITEAYWRRVSVNGELSDILWQCFERRCLAYVPDDREGSTVVSGATGQHYYMWRYDNVNGVSPGSETPVRGTAMAITTFVVSTLMLMTKRTPGLERRGQNPFLEIF